MLCLVLTNFNLLFGHLLDPFLVHLDNGLDLCLILFGKVCGCLRIDPVLTLHDQVGLIGIQTVECALVGMGRLAGEVHWLLCVVHVFVKPFALSLKYINIIL